MVEKRNPWVDHNGLTLTHNENSRVVDPRIPIDDERHIVAKLHRHLTADGKPGASGLYDPKTITLHGVKYQPIHPEGSGCELCEGGDMIPLSERHMSSTYKPDV